MITYDVRVWKITSRRRASGRTYEVRWLVARKRKSRTLQTRALAEAFRAKLLTAAREGEPFDQATGLPTSMIREGRPDRSWYDHACAFVDMKWPHAAGKTRTGIADALATVTPALLEDASSKPSSEMLRAVLYGWAFNMSTRQTGNPPQDLAEVLHWLERNALPLELLNDPEIARRALNTLAFKTDGTPAAANTVARKRAVFHSALEYAVELGHLHTNPLNHVRWRAPQTADTVDRRVVVNPTQARALLEAVRTIDPSGPRLVAFFGCIYYSALRPGEVVQLRQEDCILPAKGWGELQLTSSAPRLGRTWTDSGSTREQRQLKHRSSQEARPVPAPPDLVRLLREHIARVGAAPDGRLFRGLYGGPLSESVYGRTWKTARAIALTPAQVASPLASRPYDLRHAAVSLWLNAGVPPQQVAEWAGHSVHVLLRVYAKCLDGQQEAARNRIERALRGEE